MYAIHLPSGEKRAQVSSNSVRTTGRRSRVCRSITQMSAPVIGWNSVKAR